MKKVINAMVSAMIFADAQVINGAYLQRYLLPQLVEEYKNDKEDFLAFLPDVPADAVGKEGIYKNRLIDNVDALINNTNDFTPVAHDKKNLLVPWDTVDSTLSRVTRSQLRAMVYDVKSALRERHMKAIKRKTRDKLLHSVAPAADSADTPILTGGVTYDKIIEMREKLVTMNVPIEDCIIILNPTAVTAMAKSQGAGERFREVLFDERTGKAKTFAGFAGVFEHANVPYFDTNGDLKAFGSVVDTGAGDTQASLIINTQEVIFHRESMTLHYKEMINDTRSADPGDEFRLGGYFASDVIRKKGFAAILN